MPTALPPPLLDAFENKRYSHCIDGLQSLAEQNILPATIALAHIYFYGGGGVRRDYAEARRWLEKADREDATPYATYRLGLLYYKGLSVSVDHRRAYRLFRRAALRGDAKSRLMVGAMLRDGDGVLRKSRSAKTLLSHAARDKRLNVPSRMLAFFWKINM